jgi:hypothetical protein
MLRDLQSRESETAEYLTPQKRNHFAPLNYRLLRDIASWSLTEADVFQLVPDLSPARRAKARQQLNRDVVRVTMLILSLEAMTGQPEEFSIRKLARILDRPKEESMQRTLRSWLLPLLGEVGWVQGVVPVGQQPVCSAHKITITWQGIDAVVRYFAKLSLTGENL